MSEEIIIDEVDVAGCKDYDDGTCCNDDVLTLSCEKANCTYKQFKRLEQENKELMKQLEFSRTHKNILDAERIKYRQTLEEINILAKNYCNACDEFKVKTFKNKHDCLYCNYGFIKRKINEVLDDK